MQGACPYLALLLSSLFFGASAGLLSPPPLTTCACTSSSSQQWTVPAVSGVSSAVASVGDPSQCWQLNKTSGGVVCDGLCVYLGPCAGADTPTWSFDASTQRLTVASPPAQAGWCLDENTGALYLQAYPSCEAGDTHQLWRVDGGGRVHEQWTGDASCVAAKDAACGVPPPPPRGPFCYEYHPIQNADVYDPSGPFLAEDGLWHVWEDLGGWSHYASTDLLRWHEFPGSTGFGGLTGSIAHTPAGAFAFLPVRTRLFRPPGRGWMEC